MVSASTPGWPLCREGSPWVLGATAALWVLRAPSPRQPRAGTRPAAPARGRCFAVPCSCPQAYIYIYIHTQRHAYIYIYIHKCIYLDAASCISSPPTSSLPSPSHGRIGGLCPPTPHLISPSPPTCPRSPSTSHKWHRRTDKQMKESRMQTWNQGRRPWLELGSCRCRCAVGAGAGMSLWPPAANTGAGDVQAPRVLRHRARQRRVNRKRRGGGIKIASLVPWCKRGSGDAPGPRSALRGGTAGDHRWRGGSCRVRGDKRRRRKASRRLLPCQTHGYLPLWLSGSW